MINLYKFVYFGSTITSTISMNEELASRIGKVTAAFKKIMKIEELKIIKKQQHSNLPNKLPLINP